MYRRALGTCKTAEGLLGPPRHLRDTHVKVGFYPSAQPFPAFHSCSAGMYLVGARAVAAGPPRLDTDIPAARHTSKSKPETDLQIGLCSQCSVDPLRSRSLNTTLIPRRGAMPHFTAALQVVLNVLGPRAVVVVDVLISTLLLDVRRPQGQVVPEQLHDER